MRILVTGGRGQLGRALTRRGAARIHEIVAPDLDELDICDEAAVARRIDAIGAELVINAAAYTAVDRAESERDRAFAVNTTGPAILARVCPSNT